MIHFQKLYFHKIGDPQDKDLLVYDRPDEKEWGFGGDVTEDGKFLNHDGFDWKAIIRPSGDTAGERSCPENVNARSLTGSTGGAIAPPRSIATPIAAPIRSSAGTSNSRQPRPPIRRSAPTATAPLRGGPLPTLSMAKARSVADWNRSSGRFSIQRRAIRSSPA